MRIRVFALMAFAAFAGSIAFGEFNRGVYYYGEKNYPRAKREFEDEIRTSRAITIDAYVYLLRTLNYLGDYDAMLRVAREGIRITQTRYELFYLKGIAHYKKKEYAAALNEFNCAISLNPDSAFLYNYTGLIYRELGEFKSAENAFAFAVTLSPNAVYYNNLGNVMERQRDFETAFKYYLIAERLDETYAVAKENIQRLTANFESRGMPIPVLAEGDAPDIPQRVFIE